MRFYLNKIKGKVYKKSKSGFIKMGNIATLEAITCKKAKNKGQLTSKGVISNKGNYAKGMVMKISFVKHELITLVYENKFWCLTCSVKQTKMLVLIIYNFISIILLLNIYKALYNVTIKLYSYIRN